MTRKKMDRNCSRRRSSRTGRMDRSGQQCKAGLSWTNHLPIDGKAGLQGSMSAQSGDARRRRGSRRKALLLPQRELIGAFDDATFRCD